MSERSLERRESRSLEAQCGPLYVVLNSGAGHNEVSELREVISRVLAQAAREHEILELTDASTLPQVAALAVAKA
ncbi:MAG: hypothetical protein ACREXT_08670, partial [Gammaproteobacteria bacterium]